MLPFNTTIAGVYHTLANCEENQHKDGNNFFNATQVASAMEQSRESDAFVKPDPDAIVIHLRLGDVVEHVPEKITAATMLTEGSVGAHGGSMRSGSVSIRSFDEYLDIINNSTRTTTATSSTTTTSNNNEDGTTTNTPIGNDKIIMIGGSHYPDKYVRSRIYANCLQRGLAKAGKHAEMYLDNGDADKDFYFMTHAKRFVKSTGGFSLTISQMVEYFGGETIGGDFRHVAPVPLDAWQTGKRRKKGQQHHRHLLISSLAELNIFDV